MSSRFFKASHKNTAGHILNRGRYYEKYLKAVSSSETTCPHIKVFGSCRYNGTRHGCRDKFMTHKKVPTNNSSES